jgi:hypothetical protein
VDQEVHIPTLQPPAQSNVFWPLKLQYCCLYEKTFSAHCNPPGQPPSIKKKDVFHVFWKELLMSNSQNAPSGSNEAPKTPAPGVAAPAPQQNQGDKPATKPNEQQK